MFTVARKPTPGEYVGRPSPLGNPYYMSSEAKRNEVCDKYQEWFDAMVKKRDPAVMQELKRLYQLGKNRPVKLICYCKPKRCHADTIASFLNALIQSRQQT